MFTQYREVQIMPVDLQIHVNWRAGRIGARRANALHVATIFTHLAYHWKGRETTYLRSLVAAKTDSYA